MSEENPKPLNGGVFIGAREPVWELEHEQPWHRACAYMFALGASARSVATQMRKSQPAVQNLLRQPWFQKMVNELMAQEGNKDIMQLFKAEQYNSLCTLVTLRDDEETPAAVRLKAADSLLDRGTGKPTQRIEVSREATSDDPVAEVERLESENNRLRESMN